ncbi:Uncaracterized surface protein containing fasciclin (FAS1) repeats [Parapedobacter composti]|uniref:Uncaracterized surface protein containing fasciclin (FAS1) repeats n=1 Tax=Parapedobacter composti TaxID=623281 RepID=A0A1I1LZ92_9SPHI|nr:fasciclin domain-containing protein [Parapedobacter composti]SFC78424.1 Uncaracterized surface protein containing fasciclin (FAS1) repeats [Parapedobacter composti]
MLRFTIVMGIVGSMSLFSCSKSTAPIPVEPDYTTLTYVVEDNFNLSHLFFTLERTGLADELAGPGPYTLLASSNAGFQNVGLGSQMQLFNMPVDVLAGRVRYHIIPQKVAFKDLPIQANQPVMTSTGKPVFVTKVVRDNDTLTMVNGAELAMADFEASNGYLQVIEGFLQPFIYDNVIDNMVNLPQLSMFYLAIQKAGLEATISNAQGQTLYAPTNAALAAHGYPDLRAIAAADPEVLRQLVLKHIVNDQLFMQDYILLTEVTANNYQQTMLDGSNVTVNLQRRAGGLRPIFNISLRGPGNTGNITVAERDLVTNNGIINIINGVLE